MKNLILVLTSVLSLSAFADIAPNLYICSAGRSPAGRSTTEFGYSTDSIAGAPTFYAVFEGEEAQLPPMPKIRTQTTILGTLVSVTDAHLSLVDGPTYHYSLLVPEIKLAKLFDEVEFESYAFRTSVINPFFHAMDVKLVNNTEAVKVQCTAKAVVF